MGRSHRVTDWNPEDDAAWQAGNKRVARRTVRSILSERDTYVVSLLYICTFGSWIGFAFAFGQVMQVNFQAGGESAGHAALHAAQIAFVGSLLGSLPASTAAGWPTGRAAAA